MKRFFSIVPAILLASSAFAQSVPERTGVNSMVGVSPSTPDFVTQAAVSDMFEIQSSKLAQARADAKSKAFAGKMVKDHTATSAELKSMVKGGKVKASLPTKMDNAHQRKLDDLKKLKAEDFDKQYDSMQVDAHKAAVDLFERYAKGGDNEDLKRFAAKHLPHLKEHLTMAEELRK
jgi:putative membrane protein